MSFFGKKKEKEDSQQTNEVKNAATSTSSSAPPSPPNELNTNKPPSTGMSSEFTNPFAQQMSVPSMPASPQTDTMMSMSDPLLDSNGEINSKTLNMNSPESANMNPMNTNPEVSQTNGVAQQQTMSLDNLNQMMDNGVPKQVDKDEIQEMIDETVEKIIDERWSRLVESVEKVVKWKEKQEAQLNLVKEDIVHLRESMESMEKKVLNKISSYDSNILDVNSEIKALEKVFQKITPTLINNVNELSKITEGLRGVDKKDEISSKYVE